jgi:steroid 5-alpha reductase family enzyme
MFGLQVLWSTRLTYNAIRRGMFKKGEEDYRWPLLRQSMSRFTWEVFTLVFIATIQNILLAATALPQYLILTSKSHKILNAPRPSNQLIAGDYIIAGLLVLNLTIQFIADQQQWTYQNFKRGKDVKEKKLPDHVLKTLDSNPNVKRGFVTSGLWAYSRHPNFACEQTTW